MNKKNYLAKVLALTIVAGLMLSVINSSLAQPRKGCKGGMGKHHGGGIARLLLHAEEIGLSDAQVEKLKTLKFASKKEKIDQVADLKKMRLELREMMASDNPDESKVKQQVKKIGDHRTTMMLASVDRKLQVQEILTAEQEQKIKTLIKSRLKERKHNFRRGHRGFGANEGQFDDSDELGMLFDDEPVDEKEL